MKVSETNWESEKYYSTNPSSCCSVCGSKQFVVKPDTVNLYGEELVVMKCSNCHHVILFEIPD